MDNWKRDFRTNREAASESASKRRMLVQKLTIMKQQLITLFDCTFTAEIGAAYWSDFSWERRA